MGLSTVTLVQMDPAPVTDSLAVKSKSDYIPRKCCITNALLTSKDHASVQLNVGHVDQYGNYTVYCLSGAVRRQGEGDPGLNRLAVAAGFMNSRVLKQTSRSCRRHASTTRRRNLVF